MAIFRDIITVMTSKSISVEIDPILLPQIDCIDQISNPRIISFNLLRFILNIGTIQTRMFAVSNRNKIFDKADLIEKIYTNTNEFRVKINDIRQKTGVETLKSISEDFGVGVSIAIAENLFNIKRSTIERIYGTTKRPDWRCQTSDNRILVVECKGASSKATSDSQLANALVQKNEADGDIKIASLTLLNENSITTNRFLDPPIKNESNSPIMENHIARAGHYASVFSFLGNSKLSMYYSQLRKKLEGLLTSSEQDLKNQTFRELKTNEPKIFYQNKIFVGSLYNTEANKYIFAGIDINLLSFQGFISFMDYENDSENTINENHYILYKDGVLIIEIENIDVFSDVTDIKKIPNYQDKITISDIDEMNVISFIKYFVYLLEKNNFKNIREQQNIDDLRVDLVATLNQFQYYFEIKINKNKKITTDTLEQINYYKRRISNGKFVLVTNAEISQADKLDHNFIIIDRKKLQLLAKDSKLLIEIINASSSNNPE